MIICFISSNLLYRVLRAAELTLTALYALLGVNSVRLSQLAGDSAGGTVPRALRAADALERVDPHCAQRAADAGGTLLIAHVSDVFILEVLKGAEQGVRGSLAEAAEGAAFYNG